MRVFVTGASGWIGSALVPELIGAGHEVTGLARSDASAAALTGAGVRVDRGDLDHPGGLRGAAGASDGVIHLAFNVDTARSGDFQGAVDADRRAVEAMGEALTGSDRPLVIASATVVLAPARVGTEQDAPGLDPAAAGGPRARLATDPGGLARERRRNGVVDGRAEQALSLSRVSTEPGRRSRCRSLRSASVRRLCDLLRRVTATGITDSSRPWSVLPVTRESRASPATAPAVGPPCTGSMRHTCSAWLWEKAPAGIAAPRGRGRGCADPRRRRGDRAAPRRPGGLRPLRRGERALRLPGQASSRLTTPVSEAR